MAITQIDDTLADKLQFLDFLREAGRRIRRRAEARPQDAPRLKHVLTRVVRQTYEVEADLLTSGIDVPTFKMASPSHPLD